MTTRITAMIGTALLSLAVTVAAAAPPKRILILHSFGPEFGDYWVKPVREELDRQLPGRIDVYESWLVSARFATSDVDPAYASYLRSLFADHPLDLIITFGAPAANFVQKHRQTLFPSVPALFGDVEERRVPPSSFTENDAAVAIAVSFPAIVENILKVRPETKHLAIVIGNSPIEKFWVQELKRSLQPFANRLNLIWLNEMRFDEVLQRVATLPAGSAIFYLVLSAEVPGIPPDEDRALAKLHSAANAPMFSYSDFYLGRGIVGGALISSEEEARKTVSVAVRILEGERASDLRVAPISLSTPQFDVRELRRWNINEALLPPGSVVRFREPSAWVRYRWQIAAIGLVLLLESALIASLLYERRRRRQAEVEAHHRVVELAHLNRRATVGELSGAIAHELNQPLGAILRNTEAAEMMLQSRSPDITELRAMLADIKHDDERAGEVIRRLRRLLGKAPLETREVDLNEVLSEVFALVSTQASRRGVKLSTSLAAPAPHVSGDRIQLQQVILNLVMNSIDAVDGAGSHDRTIIGRTAVLDGTLGQVDIEDSGPGIAADKAEQIFEPFFTTKAAGMGLGLSIARTIVETHGGSIWAENQARGGAAVRFTLPLVSSKARTASGSSVGRREPAVPRSSVGAPCSQEGDVA
jgi:signal transduction histidine kinase